MQLKGSKTYENLAKSYAGESQAHIRYMFIEYGARMQGYKTMAELIGKIVCNEFNHARMFYTLLQEGVSEQIDNVDIASGYPFKEKWDLQENLRIASEDEETEEKKIYPKYMQTALDEGFAEVAKLYKDIIQVESCHKKLLKELHTQLKDKTLYKRDLPIKWKCGDCGYEATDKAAWKECPLCRAKQGSIMLSLSDN